jgi:hypothetical protein
MGDGSESWLSGYTVVFFIAVGFCIFMAITSWMNGTPVDPAQLVTPTPMFMIP